jgi:hypothetical protein
MTRLNIKTVTHNVPVTLSALAPKEEEAGSKILHLALSKQQHKSPSEPTHPQGLSSLQVNKSTYTIVSKIKISKQCLRKMQGQGKS